MAYADQVREGFIFVHDFSANKPTLPNVGADFGASGVYANYVLVKTIPANLNRHYIEICNTSGDQIVVVRDDETALSGEALNNASVFSLAGGAAAGAQGSTYVSMSFKGRFQIYAPLASAFVTVMED